MAKDYGIKVSKEGVDVKTASPSDLIYSSKWSNFKIKGVYKTDLKVTAGLLSGEATLNNPLNYAPVAFHFFDPNPYIGSAPSKASNLRPMWSSDTIYWDPINFDPTFAGAWYTSADNKFNYEVGLNMGSAILDYWFVIYSIIFIDKFGV